MIDLAGPGGSVVANDPVLHITAVVIVCMALVIVLLGGFVAISGRPLVIGRRRANQQLNGKARRFGLAQVLLGTGLLIMGSQPFLSLTWLSRDVLLGLAAILATTALGLQVSMLLVSTRKS